MSQPRLSSIELQFLQEALNSDYRIINIRLREGEYQYDLAKTIASFHLELCFPDVKDVIRRLYGEEKTKDIQFVRKIQTILKKMEKSNIVKILPKRNPWELQRYALLSMKFQDVDRNTVIFATEQQVRQTQDALRYVSTQPEQTSAGPTRILKIGVLAFIVGASYTAVVWTLMQPIIDSAIFVIAFGMAVTCSIMLGKMLSQR